MPSLVSRGAASAQAFGLFGGPSVEAETAALVARFTTAPTSTRKSQINTLIKALKDAGIWSKLDVLQVYAAADSQCALLNWKQNLYNGTLTSAPTFTADRGYTTNGSSNYVDSGFQPSTASSPQWTLNSACFGLWFNDTTSNGGGSGFSNGSNDTTLNPFNGSQHVIRINGSAALSLTASAVAGFHTANRTLSTVLEAFRNGASLGSSSGVANSALTAGTLRAGTNTATFQSHQYCALTAGVGLTTTEQTNLYNALRTYMTAVGVP